MNKLIITNNLKIKVKRCGISNILHWKPNNLHKIIVKTSQGIYVVLNQS